VQLLVESAQPALVDGGPQEREHLGLMVSFDHDILGGAPAARLTSRFAELLSSGRELKALMGDAAWQ
jgi:pyruvate/2-oxoglutarate dehydrogenase complex dihydrolipoamide acyltransferase (E2) component